ncbi:MAG: tRNA pseudouridine(38-40) synthase TruA [Synergistaceae bacterium]|jgi:tRNA pseudouridine38-40 synthase|nr:tRNA pseudouridine(38-40) synthase TruA [Synergistaceae bacterium]
MPRYALELSYDGASYSGWQLQSGGNCVQGAVETALGRLGERTRISGAGRTDAGVHAKGQVAHFDAERDWEARRLLLAVNAHLPPSISAMRAAKAGEGFHARHDAIWREYRYFIWNSSTCHPHIRPYVFWLPGSHYDWARAGRAVSAIVGTHDFAAFCRMADRPENTRRTVRSARLIARGDLAVFRIVANSYLTNMVRIAVGNLIAVASGKRDEPWLASLFEEGRDRRRSERTVPASGLFLWKVTYPEDIFGREN